MPTLTQCPGCGKLLKTNDELLGKKIKCPGCGEAYVAKAKGYQTANQKAVAAKQGGGLHISPAIAVLLSLLIIIPTIMAVWYFGPGAARTAWSKQEPEATDEVTDMVAYVLQVYVAELDLGEGVLVNMDTKVIGAGFFYPTFAFTVPEKIAFVGTSKQGQFTGFYHPATREIEADIDFGGAALELVGVTRKPKSQIHATGREIKGTLTAEIDGKPAVMPQPKPKKDR